MKKNRQFRVELGINLHAAPVPQTNPNMRIFPLQNALIDVTKGKNKPAWFSRLGTGDEISFRLVDISGLRVSQDHDLPTQYPRLVVTEFYFSDPATGQEANPFTDEIIAWNIDERLEDQYSPVYSPTDEHLLPTWDFVAIPREGKSVQTVTLVNCKKERSFEAFELTVAIRTAVDGWVNHYVFDPEMIVSESDTEGK